MPKPNKALEDALRDAMAEASRDLSEKEALETALGVAEEWQMRIAEIRAEESDDAESDDD